MADRPSAAGRWPTRRREPHACRALGQPPVAGARRGSAHDRGRAGARGDAAGDRRLCPRPRRAALLPGARATLLVASIALPAAPAAAAEGEAPSDVVIVKRPRIAAYQEVSEGFLENCRGRARVVNLGEAPLRIRPSDVVLAIGQQALDAVAPTHARIISALALHVPPGVQAADRLPSPEPALRALRAAAPLVRRLGVLYGPRTESLLAQAEEPARTLGFELVRVAARDGPSAVRALHRAADSLDAIWLAPDLDVLVPQVFLYALGLEFRRRLPVVAVTRQQVKSGALLAVDAQPRAVGRQAAALVNDLLVAAPGTPSPEQPQATMAETVVNEDIARRLGADVAALRAIGARVE